MSKRKVAFSLPGIHVILPGLSRLRIPLPGGIYMGGGKLIVGSLSAVGVGFLAALFLVINTGDEEITYPSPAAYTAPSLVGQRLVDREQPAQQSQTLQITFPGGTRLDEISFTDVSLGVSGLATSFQINGTSTAYFVIDDLIIRNSEFPSMDFANSEWYSFNATSSVVVAGHTFDMSATSTIADITVGSARDVVSYVAKDMVVDRVILQTSGSSDVIVDRLVLDGVRAWVGAFDLDWTKVGTVTFENLRVGDDGDVNSPDLVVNSTVSYTTMQDGVTEGRINIK